MHLHGCATNLMGCIFQFQLYPRAAENPTRNQNFGNLMHFMTDLMRKRFSTLSPLEVTMDNYLTSFQLIEAEKGLDAQEQSESARFLIYLLMSEKDRGSYDYRNDRPIPFHCKFCWLLFSLIKNKISKAESNLALGRTAKL